MTVLLGDTGKVAHGTLKQTNITLPTPRETTGVGLTLPTTEPGTPQISYTVQASDLATFSGNPLGVQHIPVIYAAGRIGAATTTINYRISVNGASQFQSNNANIAANNYYTHSFFRYVPLSVLDVVTVSLWSSQADTTLVYHAFTTCWTRPQLTKSGTIVKDVAYAASTAFPTLTLQPTPSAVSGTNGFKALPTNLSTVGLSFTAAAITISAMIPDATAGFGKCSNGDDSNFVQFASHATNQFSQFKNNMPASISFRDVLR